MQFLFGISHAETKHIPKRLLHISKDFDIELFFGYMLGDGYFRYRPGQGGEIVAASISKQMIKDFEQLGLSLELSGSITISKAKTDKNNVHHQTSYYLIYNNAFLGANLTKEKNISHNDLIDIFNQGKVKKKQFLDFISINGVKYRIKKVKTNNEIDINEKVYCLNTNSHNFVLNNIIVHNCLGGELSSNLLSFVSTNDPQYYQKAIQFLKFCVDLFGDDFYIECAPSLYNDQIAVNIELMKLAKKFGIKIVPGTDSHYLQKEDRAVHKAYLTSKPGEREVDDFYAFSYLMSAQEVRENLTCFTDEEVQELFDNSLDLQSKITKYSLFHKQDIPRVAVKEYPVNHTNANFHEKYPNLARLYESEDLQDRYWVNQCVESLTEKGLNNNPVYVNQLEEEARVKSIISEKLETNMFRYPNTLQHYIDLIWECGSIVGAGRGSSCAALNHYLMGITQLDPIEWGLPFFRYLNEERVELGCLILMLPSCK
jgi:hypothetical protein